MRIQVRIQVRAFGINRSEVLDRLAGGSLRLGPVHTCRLAEIRRAHHEVETNVVSGKAVVVVI